MILNWVVSVGGIAVKSRGITSISVAQENGGKSKALNMKERMIQIPPKEMVTILPNIYLVFCVVFQQQAHFGNLSKIKNMRRETLSQPAWNFIEKVQIPHKF